MSEDEAPETNRWVLVVVVVLTAIFGLCLLARTTWPCSREMIVGDYSLRNPDGTVETLTLRSDGTFVQRFGNQRNTGTWELETLLSGQSVLLHQQMIFSSTPFPWRGLIHGVLAVVRSKSGPALVMNPDAGARYVKQNRR